MTTVKNWPNDDVLEGLRCPVCSSYQPFYIHGQACFTVYDFGATWHEDLHWDDNAVICCARCGQSGQAHEFQIEETEEA